MKIQLGDMVYTTEWPYVRDVQTRHDFENTLCNRGRGGTQIANAWDRWTSWLAVSLAVIVITAMIAAICIAVTLTTDHDWLDAFLLAPLTAVIVNTIIIGERMNKAKQRYYYYLGQCYADRPYLNSIVEEKND